MHILQYATGSIPRKIPGVVRGLQRLLYIKWAVPISGLKARVYTKKNQVTRGMFHVIIQHIVTLSKYGHGELNIRRPHITDFLWYT